MLKYEEMTKLERKQYIKKIEQYLKNHQNYKAAVKNLDKQLEFLAIQENSSDKQEISNLSSTSILNNERAQNQLIIFATESALSELNETEQKFVRFRYFNNWTINKCALEMGYSDKSLFVIRNQLMDKLLITISSIIY